MAVSLLGDADHIQAGFIGSLAAAIQGETHGNIPITSIQIVERARELGAQLAFDQSRVPAAGLIEPIGYESKTVNRPPDFITP